MTLKMQNLLSNIHGNLLGLLKNGLPGVMVMPYEMKQKKRSFYLIKSRHSKAVTFPSGRVNLWETYENAARRELIEETGLSNFQIEELPIDHIFHYRKVPFHPKSTQRVFLAKVINGGDYKRDEIEKNIIWVKKFEDCDVVDKLSFRKLKETFLKVINHLNKNEQS